MGAVTSQQKRGKVRGPSRHCSEAEEGKERAVPAAGQPFMAEPDFGTGKNVVLPFPSAQGRMLSFFLPLQGLFRGNLMAFTCSSVKIS